MTNEHIKEITQDVMDAIRTKNKWNTETMETDLKEMYSKYKNKIVQIDTNYLYGRFYNGKNIIKHFAYYTKKNIEDTFKRLEINAIVKTTNRNNKDYIFIQFLQTEENEQED